MKWALLGIALAAVLPLSGWLRSNPRHVPIVWIIVGFLAIQYGPLHMFMAMISWAGMWPGYTQGAEISLVDLIILAIYFSLPRGRNSLPFLFSISFYFIAVLLSVFQASVPTAALFYCWQLARIFFVYAVVTKACADPRVVPSLLKGMALGLILAACQAVWERFALGILQTPGGFSHQNFLGVVTHFIIFPFFALLLAGERGWLTSLIPPAGAIIAVLTTSRATVAFAVLGFVLVFTFSIFRKWTTLKAKVAVSGAILFVVLSPLFISSFEGRFNSEEIGSAFLGTDDTRVRLENAASMMLSDHPMGVGANHYVFVANTQGYNEKAGLSWVSSGATVHNAYWLVATETGYIGSIAFIILLLRPLTVAFLCGWRNRGDKRGDLLLGFGVALLMVYVHSFYEWIFVTHEIEYIFSITIAMVAGLAQQLGYWSNASTYVSQSGRSSPVMPTPKAPHSIRIEPNR